MRGSTEKVIGIIVTRLNSSAESQTLSCILNELYAQNFTPLIVESQFKPEQVAQELALFQQRQVDGVILFGFSALKEKHLKGWNKAMVTVARAYIRIVMDIVFNHSSTFHEWFKQGEDPNSPYHDYYIWKEQPTNWKSKFGGSAWKWSDKAQKYYLHLFAPEQADLNWENPKLICPPKSWTGYSRKY